MPTYIQMKEIRGEPVGETIGTDLLRRGQERALVQKRALLPVGKLHQSRFSNREHQSGTKGTLL